MDAKRSDPYLPAPLAYLGNRKVWVGMEVGSDGQKRPINPFTGGLASSTDCNSWGNFNEAKRVLHGDTSSRYKPQYLAVALSQALGLTAIDLDNVIDPITKLVEPWAEEIVEEMNTYTEISQSGKGLHIYALGNKPTSSCRGEKVEIYDQNRFIMITNRPYGEVRSLRHAATEIEKICSKYLKQKKPHHLPLDQISSPPPMKDEEIIVKASKAKNGVKFTNLYFRGEIADYGSDESRADLALMGMLVFWTQDIDQLERIFSNSALGQRSKWGERSDYRKRTIEAALRSCSATYTFPNEEIIKAFHDNEVGDARLFLKLHGEKHRFDATENAFYYWNGMYWEVDHKKMRYEDAKDVAECYQRVGLENETLSKELNKRAFALKGSKRLKNLLEVAVHGKEGLTFTGEWDNTANLLPCKNGVVDLRTAELFPSSPSLSIRNICPTLYDPHAKCPLFEQFIKDIMLDVSEMIEFLQCLTGYILLGMPMEHIFVIFYGENGRNGKGTFCRLLQKILGTFAKTFSPEMVLLQKSPPSSGNPRADLINLQGTRFAIFSEINKKRCKPSKSHGECLSRSCTIPFFN